MRGLEVEVGIRWVIAGVVGSMLALVPAMPAAAQTAAAKAAPATGESRVEVEAGVNFVTWVKNQGLTHTYSGWHAGASYRVARWISVLTEVTGDYRSETGYTANIYTYSGGARFQLGQKDQRLRPYFQILLGGGQDNGTGDGRTNRYPVLAPGAGADLSLSDRVAIRFRLDFPLLMTFGDPLSGQISAGHTLKGTRLGAGVTFPFGSR